MSAIIANFTDGVVTASDDGGHSATLTLSMGDLSITGITPTGRSQDALQSRGAFVGLRQGQRKFAAGKVSGHLATPTGTFPMLVLGNTAGFVSTCLSLGDGKAVDLTFSFSYGAETRTVAMQDVVFDEVGITEGDPGNSISYSFTIYGPVSMTGPEGTFTVIPSR